MKKIGLMVIAIAMLFVFTIPVFAAITAVNAGSGDALVLPLTFMDSEKNEIALRNNSKEFIQAHIRFRTGLASREVRDFDIIFSPWDVVTIYLIPVMDSITGEYEITQISSKDKSFRYNPLSQDYDAIDGFVTNYSEGTIIQSAQYLSEIQVNYEKTFGYVEVFGEAVLVGLTKPVADALVAAKQPINAWQWYQWNKPGGLVPKAGEKPIYTAVADATAPKGVSTVVGGVGTIVSTFNNCLADLGNVLTGVTYIINKENGGIAIDATALQNFRTNTSVVMNHRDGNNYLADAGVILHDSNFVGTTQEALDYRYAYNDSKLPLYQKTMYWATTFGPTWLDGDDVDAIGSSEYGEKFYAPVLGVVDIVLNAPTFNSLDEVEAALANIAGTTTHYFNNDKFNTFFMLTYPTKHLHFPENQVSVGTLWTGWKSVEQLIQGGLVGYSTTSAPVAKLAIGSTEVCVDTNPTIFDTEENGVAASTVSDNVSPIFVQPPASPQVLCWEVNFANVAMFGVEFTEGWMSLKPSGPVWAGAYAGISISIDMKTGELAFNNQLNK